MKDGAGTRFFYWNRRLLLAALLAGLLYWRSTQFNRATGSHLTDIIHPSGPDNPDN